MPQEGSRKVPAPFSCIVAEGAGILYADYISRYGSVLKTEQEASHEKKNGENDFLDFVSDHCDRLKCRQRAGRRGNWKDSGGTGCRREKSIFCRAFYQ